MPGPVGMLGRERRLLRTFDRNGPLSFRSTDSAFSATIAARAMQHSDDQLDARGLLCPEPLMLVRNRVREMTSGQVLHVLATDPTTSRDFTNFCRFMGHELLEETQLDQEFHFWIRKG